MEAKQLTATISVNALRLYAHHGVLPQERLLGNAYEVSLSIQYPLSPQAYLHDSLDGTLDYARAVEVAQRCMAEPSNLLEHVAHRIARELLRQFPRIAGGTVSVAKLTPPIAATLGSVAVEIPIIPDR